MNEVSLPVFYLVTDEQIDILVERAVKKVLEVKPAPIEIRDKIGIAEAQVLTGLKRSAIYQKSHLGQIPCAHFGKKLVFSRKALFVWMKENTIPKKSPKDAAIFHLQKEAHRKTG